MKSMIKFYDFFTWEYKIIFVIVFLSDNGHQKSRQCRTVTAGGR